MKIIIATSIILSFGIPQNSGEYNCGSGTVEQYLIGEIDCVCNLECAGYASTCCDFYDICYGNPTTLTFDDIIGEWNERIIGENFSGHSDSIGIRIFSNNSYFVFLNLSIHLMRDNYPGTEEVYYNSIERILSLDGFHIIIIPV